MAIHLIKYRVDQTDPDKAADRTLDITPAWWCGGPGSLADGADVLRKLEQMAEALTPSGAVICEATTVHVGVRSVSLTIALREDMPDEVIEVGRVGIIEKLDALAEDHPGRQEIIAMRREAAEERRARMARSAQSEASPA